jgi:serine-type D-Ala-D-Ala carboxypeptidase (penicillin-binding protein 5/6)
VLAAHLTVAGHTLTLVGAILGQPGAETPQQLAAVDQATVTLLTAAAQTIGRYTLLPQGPVGVLDAAWAGPVPVDTDAPLRVLGWPGLAVAIDVHQRASGRGIRPGQPLGAVTVHNTVTDSGVTISAGARLPAPSWWWRLHRTGR